MNTRRLAVMITPLALCLILASGTRGWAEELKNGVGIGPFMLAAYSSSSHDSEDLKIGAGAAPTENIFNQIKEPMEKSIGLKMAVISNGPVAAWKELDNGTVHAASAGLSFSDWVALMQKEGYRIADQDQYHHWEIGVDSGRVIFNGRFSG